MTYRNLVIPLALAVSTAACGNSADSASTQASAAPGSTQASTATASHASACLQQHSGTLDTLLAKQAITPYVQGATEDIEANYDKKHSDEISYTWPSDRSRTISVSGTSITIPVSNIISLGGIKTYTKDGYYAQDNNDPVKRFQRAHHNLTAEEKAKARAAINKNMEKESKTTRKIGGAILSKVSSRIMFEPVAGVGDAAAWDLHAKELDILAGETEFSVHVDVSAESEKNKAVARKLAQSILAACADGA